MEEIENFHIDESKLEKFHYFCNKIAQYLIDDIKYVGFFKKNYKDLHEHFLNHL